MCFAIKYRHPSKKKKCSVTYTNASSCLFTAPFCTSKLQISSPGLYMLLKHVHGLAGVNIFHSSPPGTVFYLCWNSAGTAPKLWLLLNCACSVPRHFSLLPLSPSPLTHQHTDLGWATDWEGTQAWQMSWTGQRKIPQHRTTLCNKSCSTGSRKRRWGLASLWLLLRDCLGICLLLRAVDWFPVCHLFPTTTFPSPSPLSILIHKVFPVSDTDNWTRGAGMMAIL